MKQFKKLALMGLVLAAGAAQAETAAATTETSTTVARGGCGGAGKSCNGYASCSQYRPGNETADAYQNPNQNPNQQMNPQTQRMLTEGELVTQLNDEGKQIWTRLTPQGKALALRFASQENQINWQGQFIGPFRNKNDAVKAAARIEDQSKTNAPTTRAVNQYQY